jgi:hypothetical protein
MAKNYLNLLLKRLVSHAMVCHTGWLPVGDGDYSCSNDGFNLSFSTSLLLL